MSVKPSVTIALVVVAVLATVAIGESRIASLRSRLERVEAAQAKSAAVASASGTPESAAPSSDSQPSRVRERSDEKGLKAGTAPADDSKDFAKTVRKMWENPAGKSMMSQGVKMAVAMMYGDFIDGMDLTKEEADYFRSLLGKEMAEQQELGMKMMGASAEERKAMVADLSKRSEENEKAIKDFLNSEDDYKKFQAFKERLPERQQLDGLRTLMASKEVPMDAATEDKLVDAMYRARTQSNTMDLNGVKGLEEMAKGDIVQRFEADWTRQQENLRKEVGGVLDETQLKAFTEYQEQMKEFQLMGLKMVSDQEGEDEEEE